MAKTIGIFVVLVGVGVSALFALLVAPNTAVAPEPFRAELFPNYNTMRISLSGAEIAVWVADTFEKQARGLMGVHELPEGRGMIFFFDTVGDKVFWNKDTLIDLDVLWIQRDSVVGVSSLPRQQGKETVQVRSPNPVDTVLEVPAGWALSHGISAGDSVLYASETK